MKLISFLFKNWQVSLLIAVAGPMFFAWELKSNKIEKLTAEKAELVVERDAAKQDVKLAGVVLDSTHAAARRLTAIRQADSTAFAKRIDGMQSVVSVLQKERVKLRNENEYFVKNPVRIDLIDRTRNFWGTLKDSTYTEGWIWVKD